MKPVVNVPAPVVNVDAPNVNVDTDTIADAIKKAKPAPTKATSDEGSTIYYEGQAYSPQHVPIEAMERGASTVVGAVKGKSILIISCFLMSAEDTEIRFIADDNSIVSGEIALLPSTGFVLPYNPVGWGKTNTGKGLVLNQTSKTTIGGLLTYIEV